MSEELYVAGVDIGSIASKALILNPSGEIISSVIGRSVHNASVSASNVMEECLDKGGLSFPDLSYIVATGYGRVKVPFANKLVSEIICHARGINRIFPSVRTIVDLGGQDSKGILIDADGKVRHFVMNDKCAAGTGRFLEVMASALDVSLDELGTLAISSPKRPRISNICTIFAESEIIGMLAEGLPKESIAAGLCDSISSRIYRMIQTLGAEKDFVMTGGGAKNAGIVKMLGERMGAELLVPTEPQITGALGAAIIGMDIVADEHLNNSG